MSNFDCLFFCGDKIIGASYSSYSLEGFLKIPLKKIFCWMAMKSQDHSQTQYEDLDCSLSFNNLFQDKNNKLYIDPSVQELP